MVAIQSFGNKTTELFYLTGTVSKGMGWGSVKGVALRKLDMVHYAKLLDDLRSPPSNHLEKLKGNLIDYYSIRINDKWRLLFQWTVHGPCNVKIIDYHS